MAELLSNPVDVQGRGRSGKLWQNFPDAQTLFLDVGGQGYGIVDDFYNFGGYLTSNVGYGPWSQYVSTNCGLQQYGNALGNPGKGGVLDFYGYATNNLVAQIQGGGGTAGMFYFDLLAQKYMPVPPLQVPGALTGPQCSSYANDLVFEARVALLTGSTSTPTMPTTSPGPISNTTYGHNFFIGLSQLVSASATNFFTTAVPNAFAPGQDCIGFYLVQGTSGSANPPTTNTAGMLNFGFQHGSSYPQTLTNITVSPPTLGASGGAVSGAAASPFVNAYNAAVVAVAAATANGAASAQYNQVGQDYLWVNLGFRFYAASQTIQLFVNGNPVPGGIIFQGNGTNYTAAAANAQAYPNTPTGKLGGVISQLDTTPLFPNTYLAPTITLKQYNSSAAVTSHLLVDWIAVAQTN